MKRFTIFLVSMAFVAFTYAQRAVSTATMVQTPPFEMTKSGTQPKAVDTLRNHLNHNLGHTPTLYGAQTGGFIAGHNGYGDIAKAQKFDSAYGVTSGGTITALLFRFGAKRQNAGTAIVTPTIWGDNNGVPGTVLATGTAITVAEIDTSAAAYQAIGHPSTPDAVYNVVATFNPAVTIPPNQIFWAGFSMTYATGDLVGLVTSNDPSDAEGDGNFLDAPTHTFEQWSDNAWNPFCCASNTWRLEIAMAVYPVVDLTGGVDEITTKPIYIFPNPVKDEVYITSSDVKRVEIYDLIGKIVAQFQNQNVINLSNYQDGTYIIRVITNDKVITRKIDIVK